MIFFDWLRGPYLVFLLVPLFLLTVGAASAQQQITLRFCNIEKAEGSLFLAIYDKSDCFMVESKAVFSEIIPVEKAGCFEKSVSLPEGTYAVSCFHDINNNKKLDKTMIGIPKEPYGFTGTYDSKWKAPSWEETHIPMQPGKTYTVSLDYW